MKITFQELDMPLVQTVILLIRERRWRWSLEKNMKNMD